MKPLIVANWKCNPSTIEEAGRIFNSVKRDVKNIKNAEVVICPPFVYLPLLIAQDPSSAISFGGQNCFWENEGAYTGEISPTMLKNSGVEHVIVGHSERRKYQQETNEMIEKKLKAVLGAGLKPILCIDKISQIPRDIKGSFIIAYEPLFAIGTGKPCSVSRARKMKEAIKRVLGKNFPVLYGGSVNPQNAREYIKKAKFDGLLVGGASLKPREFIDIVKAAC